MNLPWPVYGQDLVFHFFHSGGSQSYFFGLEKHWNPDSLVNDSYPPFVHIVSFPFASFSLDAFIWFWLIIILVLTPIVLAWVLYDFRALMLYFCMPLPYFTIYFFTLSQFAITILGVAVLILLCRRDRFRYLSLLAFPFSLIIHNQGFYLIFLVFILFFVYEFFKRYLFPPLVSGATPLGVVRLSLAGFPVVVFQNELPLATFPLHVLFLKFFCFPLWFLVRRFNVFLFVSLVISLLSFFMSSRIINSASLFLLVGVVLSLSDKERVVSDKLFIFVFLLMFFSQLFLG